MCKYLRLCFSFLFDRELLEVVSQCANPYAVNMVWIQLSIYKNLSKNKKKRFYFSLFNHLIPMGRWLFSGLKSILLFIFVPSLVKTMFYVFMLSPWPWLQIVIAWVVLRSTHSLVSTLHFHVFREVTGYGLFFV